MSCSHSVDMCVVYSINLSLCSGYLCDVLGHLGVRCKRVVHRSRREVFDSRKHPAQWHMFVGYMPVRQMPSRYIVWQIEQVTSSFFQPAYVRLMRHATHLWHFSPQSLVHFHHRHSNDDDNDDDDVWVVPFPLAVVSSAECLGSEAPEAVEAVEATNRHTTRKILFYGAMNARRNRVLCALKQHFGSSVRVVMALGDKLVREIRDAAVVVNIHYYDQASLELARFNEVIGVGRPIVSEDPVEEDTLSKHHYTTRTGECGAVFAPLIQEDLSNIASFVQKVRFVLEHHPGRVSASYRTRIQSIGRQAVQRALMPLRLLSIPYQVDLQPNRMCCLHLPEAPSRVRSFLEQEHAPSMESYEFVPGVKGGAVWKCRGQSHYNVIWNAKRLGRPHIVVFEDDCTFPKGFETRLQTVLGFLSTLDEWHIFTGYAASLPADTSITVLSEHDGLQFMEMDKMNSMTFSIYHQSVYDKILEWGPEKKWPLCRIERYIQNIRDLKIITTHPFFVKCTNESDGVLWGEEECSQAQDIPSMFTDASTMLETSLREHKPISCRMFNECG